MRLMIQSHVEDDARAWELTDDELAVIAEVAINAMRPLIRAEALEEAARICDEADVKEREFFVGADNAIDEVIYDRGSYVARISAAAIRALKEKP